MWDIKDIIATFIENGIYDVEEYLLNHSIQEVYSFLLRCSRGAIKDTINARQRYRAESKKSAKDSVSREVKAQMEKSELPPFMIRCSVLAEELF